MTIYEEQYKIVEKEVKTVQGQMRYDQQKANIAKEYTKELEVKYDAEVRASIKDEIMKDMKKKMIQAMS